MKIEFIAAADPNTTIAEDSAPARRCVFIEDFPKSGPVLQSSYIFPKVESYGVWTLRATPGPKPVSTDE